MSTVSKPLGYSLLLFGILFLCPVRANCQDFTLALPMQRDVDFGSRRTRVFQWVTLVPDPPGSSQTSDSTPIGPRFEESFGVTLPGKLTQQSPVDSYPRSKRLFNSVTLMRDGFDDQKLAARPSNGAELPSPLEAGTCAENPHSKTCRVRFLKAIVQSFIFLGIETAGNLAQDPGVRETTVYNISSGHFWSGYWKTLQNFRYTVWNDDDTLLTTYVGHPLMGAEIEFIWIQNNPKIRALEFQNSKTYWKSRLWAMMPSALFSAEWLLGPLSESSMGNQGRWYYHDKTAHAWTNGTGFQDFVITPVGGLLWSVGEDWLDLHVGKRIRLKYKNPGMRLISALVTPTKSGANVLRFKTPWYRDSEQEGPSGILR